MFVSVTHNSHSWFRPWHCLELINSKGALPRTQCIAPPLSQFCFSPGVKRQSEIWESKWVKTITDLLGKFLVTLWSIILSLEIIISISFNYIPLPINAHFCLVPIYLSLICKLFFRLKLHAFPVLCLSSLFPSSISWLLNKNFISYYLLDYLRQWMIIFFFFYSLINKENVEL